MQERLQKLIAQAGISSRRKAEELMRAGRVSVNGKIASELGTKADWQHDHIVVDGKRIQPETAEHHLLFYKPKGVVTTLSDPEGRPAIHEYLRGIPERLYPVGRLDFHSEGLLILTNDGELANRVLHASTALPKTYWVKVGGRPTQEQIERLRAGVYVDGRRTAPAQIRWLEASRASGRERERAGVYRTSTDNPWLEVVLIEGRHHQIRKMFLSIGHPVEKLKRVAIGKITIGKLKSGQMRPLTEIEVRYLRQATERENKRPAPRATASRPGRTPNRATTRPGRAPERSPRRTRE
ncbi:MAG TPA: pseudouridine synthase [Terriglobales bacterium]